jgi:hypothetical protein
MFFSNASCQGYLVLSMELSSFNIILDSDEKNSWASWYVIYDLSTIDLDTYSKSPVNQIINRISLL